MSLIIKGYHIFKFWGNLIINPLLVMYNKDRWSSSTILSVWNKGIVVSGNDSNVFRKDACGAWMEFGKHGDRDAKYGWEIDHIVPVASNGPDVISNLQPLHWKNNLEKGDSSQLRCAVRD